MEFFITLYHLLLLQPIFNLLVLLTEYVPGKDFGVAVILLTLIVRFASYPLGAKAVTAQKKFAELQPKIKEIQEKFKDKKEEQTKAMMALYKEAKVNPFASLAPLLIQLPIFFVLYQIFAHGLGAERFHLLYSFVQAPAQLDTTFFRMVDLNARSFPIALVAGALQFLQMRQMQPAKKEGKEKKGKPDMSSMVQKQMMYVLPVIIVWVASTLPSAFGLYIITTTVFSIWQHWFITRRQASN